MPALYDSQSLAALPLFRDLAPTQLPQLNSLLRRKSFRAEANLLVAGQASEVLYILLNGTVKICADQPDGAEVLLAICGAGEILGEINALDGLGHSADVVALEPSTCLTFERTNFCECLDTMPILARNLACILAARLRRISAHAQSLAAQDVHGRVACQILSFARDYGQPAANGDIVIPLRLTQSDLSNLLGACRQRINQAMVYYQRNHYISVDPTYRITIHNRAALAKRCQQGL